MGSLLENLKGSRTSKPTGRKSSRGKSKGKKSRYVAKAKASSGGRGGRYQLKFIYYAWNKINYI